MFFLKKKNIFFGFLQVITKPEFDAQFANAYASTLECNANYHVLMTIGDTDHDDSVSREEFAALYARLEGNVDAVTDGEASHEDDRKRAILAVTV